MANTNTLVCCIAAQTQARRSHLFLDQENKIKEDSTLSFYYHVKHPFLQLRSGSVISTLRNKPRSRGTLSVS